MGTKNFLLQVEGIGDAALAVDAAGVICAWNAAAEQLFGWSENEAINTWCHKILQCSDENGLVCGEQCVIERAALEKGPLTSFDLRVQTKTGKQWCNVSTLKVSDSEFGELYAIHVIRPREMRKRLEQALSEFVRLQASTRPNGSATNEAELKRRVSVRLTSREVEVLRSLAQGRSTKTIANQLNISHATVNNHIKHILRKLDAHTRLEAIRYAESVGVI